MGAGRIDGSQRGGNVSGLQRPLVATSRLPRQGCGNDRASGRVVAGVAVGDSPVKDGSEALLDSPHSLGPVMPVR